MGRGVPFEERYELLEVIGEGTTGVVHRALQKGLQRVVAIKFLKCGPGLTPDVEARFVRESRILASLHHPHILRVFDCGEDGSRKYLVTEFFDGPTMLASMETRPIWDVSVALQSIDQLLDALDQVHRSGVLHRDIKPANILMSPAGGLRLADFGLAMILEGGARLTRPDGVVGTLAYVAPETFRDGVYSPASDLYAVGTILFELLSGRFPIPRRSVEEHIRHKLSSKVSRLADEMPGCPPRLAEIVGRCLEAEPLDRYRDAGELRHDLARCTPRPAIDRKARAPGRRGRRGSPLALTGALLVVLSSSIWFISMRRPEAHPRPHLRIEPAGRGAMAIHVESAPVGSRLALSLEGRTLESIALTEPTTTVRFENIPARVTVDLQILQESSGRILAASSIQTPVPSLIRDFTCVPMHDRVFVAFEMAPPGSAIVRCLPLHPGTDGTTSREALVRTTGAASVELGGLKADVDYLVSIIPSAGWGGLSRYPFRSRSEKDRVAVEEAIGALNDSRLGDLNVSIVLRTLEQFPDSRSLPVVRRLLQDHDWSMAAITRGLLGVIENFRDARSGPMLSTLSGNLPDASDRRRAARCLLFARHPGGPDAVLREFRGLLAAEDPRDSGTAFDLTARALLTKGDPRACESILAAGEVSRSNPATIAAWLIRVDRAEARRIFRTWIAGGSGLTDRIAAGMMGLGTLGESVDLETLTGPSGLSSPDPGRRLCSAEALSRTGSAAFRDRALEAFRNHPEELPLLWLVARLSLVEALPLVTSLTRPGRGSALRHDATLVLGMLGECPEPALSRLLELVVDGDPTIARAAVWALGRAGRSLAIPSLIRYATTSGDAMGVATWALGQLSRRASAAERKLIEAHRDGVSRRGGARWSAPGILPPQADSKVQRELLFPFVPYHPTGLRLVAGDCVTLEIEAAPEDARSGSRGNPAPRAIQGPSTLEIEAGTRTVLIAETNGELTLCPGKGPADSLSPLVLVLTR